MSGELTPAARARRVRLLILDIDGVLTDGGIFYDAQGREIKRFDVRDGHGLKLLMRAGFMVGLVTGRAGEVNRVRAEELGIELLRQGAKFKLPVVQELAREVGVGMEEVAYMGDDLIDIPPMRAVGLAMAPADAIKEVRALAHWVATRPGGRGAVREACEFLLKASGKWGRVTERYFS